MAGPRQASDSKASLSRGSSHDRILHAAKRLFASKGYENTSTVAIARMAGTSESQLMKHFGSKEGLLEAVFERAWRRINWEMRRRIERLASRAQKFKALVDLTVTALGRDRELKVLLLLQGRHIRKDGQMILLDQGFLEFVRTADGILREMRAAGQLRSDAQVETVRSALMGAMEGMLRDQLLAQRVGYPARYSAKQVRQVFGRILTAFTSPTLRPARGKARA